MARFVVGAFAGFPCGQLQPLQHNLLRNPLHLGIAGQAPLLKAWTVEIPQRLPVGQKPSFHHLHHEVHLRLRVKRRCPDAQLGAQVGGIIPVQVHEQQHEAFPMIPDPPHEIPHRLLSDPSGDEAYPGRVRQACEELAESLPQALMSFEV